MPKVTRKITQYQTLVLYENTSLKIDKKAQHRTPVAVFDDAKLCSEYQDKQDKPKDHLSYEVQEEWSELEPQASNFNMPFNPKPVTTPVKATKKSRVAFPTNAPQE